MLFRQHRKTKKIKPRKAKNSSSKKAIIPRNLDSRMFPIKRKTKQKQPFHIEAK